VRCSEILGSKTLSQAISRVTRGQRSCSANFLIGQQTKLGVGKIVDIESAPQATSVLSPEDGVLAHTNHFSNPEQLGVKQVLDEERKSTLHRFTRITRLLRQVRSGNGKMSMTKAEEMLRDHDGKPESVCRHENLSLPVDERYRTVVSVVMDLYTSQLQTTLGSPCEREYQTLRL
jgi:isopenicillin-N N-acyltransferase-like protein